MCFRKSEITSYSICQVDRYSFTTDIYNSPIISILSITRIMSYTMCYEFANRYLPIIRKVVGTFVWIDTNINVIIDRVEINLLGAKPNFAWKIR